MVGKMKNVGLTKEAAMQNMMRNPQQMLSKLQSVIDPRILKQMGGAGNMVNLLKDVSRREPLVLCIFSQRPVEKALTRALPFSVVRRSCKTLTQATCPT